MQLACARASRCMNGDRFALSGRNSLAGTRPLSTSTDRITSMSTSRASAQAMNPVSAIAVGVDMFNPLSITV